MLALEVGGAKIGRDKNFTGETKMRVQTFYPKKADL